MVRMRRTSVFDAQQFRNRFKASLEDTEHFGSGLIQDFIEALTHIDAVVVIWRDVRAEPE